MKPVDLEDRLVDFAVRVVNVVEALPDLKAGNHIARQLVRTGTSAAPNYGEAQSEESRRDFVHMPALLVAPMPVPFCAAESLSNSISSP